MCMQTCISMCTHFIYVCVYIYTFYMETKISLEKRKTESRKTGILRSYRGWATARVWKDEWRGKIFGSLWEERSLDLCERKESELCFPLIVAEDGHPPVSTYIPSIQGINPNWLTTCKLSHNSKLPEERIWPVYLRLGVHPLVQSTIAKASVTQHKYSCWDPFICGAFDCCPAPPLDYILHEGRECVWLLSAVCGTL